MELVPMNLILYATHTVMCNIVNLLYIREHLSKV